MTRLGARTTPAAMAVVTLALAACNSFSFKLESPDMSRVHSLFVIVDSREKLKHESEEATKNLVRPERYDEYPFFVQFLPKEGGTWQQMERRKLAVEPKVKKDRIALKFPPGFIELQTDPLIALVVRFDDNTWMCETDPLVLEGEAEYVISSTQLLPKR